MKKDIKLQGDLKKMWDETRDYLKKIGLETSKIAKKGEEEVVRASKIAKLHLDVVSINVKKEKLFRDIGKKAVTLAAKNKLTVTPIKKMCEEVLKLDKEIDAHKQVIAKETKAINKAISTTSQSKKTAAKKSPAKKKTAKKTARKTTKKTVKRKS